MPCSLSLAVPLLVSYRLHIAYKIPPCLACKKVRQLWPIPPSFPCAFYLCDDSRAHCAVTALLICCFALCLSLLLLALAIVRPCHCLPSSLPQLINTSKTLANISVNTLTSTLLHFPHLYVLASQKCGLLSFLSSHLGIYSNSTCRHHSTLHLFSI